MLSSYVGFYDNWYKFYIRTVRGSSRLRRFLRFTVHSRMWKTIYRLFVQNKQFASSVILIVYLFVRFHRTRRLTPTDSIALSGDRRPSSLSLEGHRIYLLSVFDAGSVRADEASSGPIDPAEDSTLEVRSVSPQTAASLRQ